MVVYDLVAAGGLEIATNCESHSPHSASEHHSTMCQAWALSIDVLYTSIHTKHLYNYLT